MRRGLPFLPTIRSQLLAAFALMLLFMVAGAATGLRYAGVIHDRLERVYGQQLVAIKFLDENRLLLYRIDRALRQWQGTAQPPQRQELAEGIGKDLASLARPRDGAGDAPASPVEAKLRNAFRKGLASYTVQVQAHLGGGDAPPPDAALFDELDRRLGELIELNQNAARTDFEYAKVDQEKTFAWLAGSLAAACVIGFGLAVVIVRSISRRLDEALALAQRVAAGDLTAAAVSERNDEVGRLLQSMRVMVSGLVPVLHNIRGASHAIHAATAELSAGSRDLALRTERQVSAADELASTARSLHGAARANAEVARAAIGTAGEAEELAHRGAGAVARLVDRMQAIEAQARQIGEISGLIDTISFKTNILALNAAVEAAHAGKHGLGFAAVASEVRSLANHVASQAKQIGALIETCSREVAVARALVGEVNGSIDTIAAGVNALGESMRRIVSASADQLASSERVSAVASQVDEDIKRNAALADESMAMTAAFNEQAAQLAAQLGVFKLPEQAGDAAHEPVAPAPAHTAAPPVTHPAPLALAAR